MTGGLECAGVGFSRPPQKRGESAILEDINVCFDKGSLSLITGKTGSGKTTLLHVLGGLYRPTCGRVIAGGQPVSQWISRHRDIWRRRVGIVFQDLYLMDHLSVMENVMLPMFCRPISLPDLRARGRSLLEALDLEDHADERTGSLSGGQRQRTAIARALIGDPEYILADEPSAYQDDVAALLVFNLLARRTLNGAVVVVCSHDPRLRETRKPSRQYLLENRRLTPVYPMERSTIPNPGVKL